MGNDEDSDQVTIDNEAKPSSKKTKLSTKEEGQVIRARAFLNRLDTKIQEKEEIVKQIRYRFISFSYEIFSIHIFYRESIYSTKDKVTKLEHQKHRLENELDQAQDQRNL